MAKHRYQHQIDWSRIRDRLIYLPVAFILGYGLWLALIT
jgi:hypothetical protein